MKKTLGLAGLVLVLSVFGLSQTASASEWDARGNNDRGPRVESRQSQKLHSPGRGSKEGFRDDHDRREFNYRQQDHHYERRLPAGYKTLRIMDRILYYLNGMFYQSTPYGYEVVSAPTGTLLSALPAGYYQVLYGGTTYYIYNNIYYVRGPMGYCVVTPPAQMMMYPV